MAAATIGSLRVNLGLDSAQFQNGLNRSQSGMQKFAKAAAIGFAAVAAAGAAAFASVASAAERADNAWKQSQALGIPIQDLGRLQHAADMSGASFNDLERTIRRTSQAINNSTQGISNTGTKSFERMGVALKDAEGNARSTADVMGDVAEVFSNMPDGATKTALAVDMFGRSGAQMIPMLNAGRDGLAAMGDEAERLGLVFDENTGRMAERFNDNLSRMAKATTGLVNAFGTMLLPAAVAVTDAIVAMTVPAGEMIGILGEVARWAGVAVAGLAGFFAPAMMAGLATLSAAIGGTLVGAIRAVGVAMAANPLGLLIGAIAAVVAAAFLFRDDIVRIFGIDIVDAAANVANKIIGAFVGAYEAVKDAWGNLPAFFSGLGKKAYNSLLQSFSGPALTIETPWGSWESGGLNLTGAEAKLTPEEEAAFGRASAVFDQNYNRDYIGDWSGAIENAGNTSAETLAKINSLADGLGGGASGDGKGGGLAGATKTASDALEKMGDVGDQVTSKLASTFTDMFVAVLEGGKNIGDMIGSLLKDLGKMFLNQGFQALLGMMSGGLGGGGGLFAGIGKLLGFARGGTIMPGGAGGIDSQLVAFRKSPNERVDITKPGQTLTSGGGRMGLDVSVSVDEQGNLVPMIRKISGEGDVRVVKSLERGLPGLLAEAQMRQG